MIKHLNKDSFRQKVFDYQNDKRYRFEGETPGADRFLHELVYPVQDPWPDSGRVAKRIRGEDRYLQGG